MAKPKGGLGKGLSALIRPSVQTERPDGQRTRSISTDIDSVSHVEISKIRPNPYQPLADFDPKALDELRESKKEKGIIQNNIKRFVTVDAPVVALTHAKVLDGTGAPVKSDQTLIIRDGRIAAIGASASTPVPEGATVIDLTGKTVMPGMVMMHEHLYYPTGPGVYGQLGESFTQLYLAGGVTAMRTGGNVHGTMDINMKRLIDSGAKPGPWMDATAPYLNGPNTFQQMRALTGPDDARRQVNYWADEGATSFKAYMNISRDDLAAAVSEAHTRGLKVTGHLCSVTYAEAAELESPRPQKALA